ncbi:hypothetical protein BD311DRAFT_722696 [Dichomitus squalens]|uniref:DUF6533 domain-containing protein n=1 Tax=Dichomitus squalens TaxID=114155 RepID=A0A4V2K0B9_9APHY|nr:hypothetical protein BD311DRAFT_722696 [Dichomitus squalens]
MLTTRNVFCLTALLVYHYLLTFSREVKLCWTRRPPAASILFLLNRYLAIASQVAKSFPIPWSCEAASESDFANITSFVFVLKQPLQSILMSVFVISLQKVHRKLAGTSRSISLGEIAFQPPSSSNTSLFVGSLEARLSVHGDGIGDEDEDDEE